MCVFVQRTRFSVHALSLGLISAEGFKATNTFSWLGTSDILFCYFIFSKLQIPGGARKQNAGRKKILSFLFNNFLCKLLPTGSISSVKQNQKRFVFSFIFSCFIKNQNLFLS